MENTRKQQVLPEHLDKEQFEAYFERLERYPDKPHSQRIEKILELISALKEDASTAERSRILTSLRNALRHYKWVSQISPTREGLRVISFPARRGHHSADVEWEYGAVNDLLALIPYLGRRPRIRRCELSTCRKWFFAAKRDDQRFHHTNCKQNNYDNEKSEKRTYMRTHRARKKAQERRWIGKA